jgi:hypothetical protein
VRREEDDDDDGGEDWKNEPEKKQKRGAEIAR